MDTMLVEETGTTEYFKALLTGILPIILIIVPILFWLILKPFPCLKLTWKGVRDRIILCIVILLYMVHPSVTSMAVGLFNCYKLENDETWLYKDLSIKCWDSDH